MVAPPARAAAPYRLGHPASLPLAIEPIGAEGGPHRLLCAESVTIEFTLGA
jgi:hypothetical protein